MFNDPSRGASPTRCSSADVKHIGDCSLPGCPFIFGPLKFTTLLNIQGCVRLCLSESHFSESFGSEGMAEVLGLGYFDTYEADVESEGEWNLLYLNGALDLCNRASIHVDCDQLRMVRSTASLPFPTYVVDSLILALPSVPALSDRPVLDRRVTALAGTLDTNNERITALESEVASNDAKVVAKMAQADSLGGGYRIEEEAESLVSVTIREDGPLLCTAEEARSGAEVFFRSAESPIGDVCGYGSPLQKEVSQLRSDKTCLEEQGKLEARRDGHTCNLIDKQTTRIIECMRISSGLELNMIKNLLTFGMIGKI